MDTEKLAAILIPCYNAAPHLEQCLESAIAQNFPVFLCDDGSTDNSLEIARRFPIEIISNPRNLGVGKTRQRLLRLTKSRYKYLQFFDADDFFLSETKVLTQVNLLESTSVAIAIDDIMTLYPDGTTKTVEFCNIWELAENNRIWHLNACLFATESIPNFRNTLCCNDAFFLVDCLKRQLESVNTYSISTCYRKNWGWNQITANYHRTRERYSVIIDRALERLVSDSKF